MNTKTLTFTFTPTLTLSLLLVTLVTLAGLYMYFLTMSVVHVVLRKEVNQERRLVESEIAELEARYIEAQHRVSEKIASLDTLAETNDKIFVERQGSPLVMKTE